MIEEYVNTITTIEIDEDVTVLETTRVELVTISTPGVQGPALKLTVANGGDVFNEVDSIEIGDNLEITENPDGSIKIAADHTGATAQEVIEAIEQELADNTVKLNFVDTDQILLQLPAFDEVISITAFINELGQSIIVKPATSLNPTTNILTVNFVSPQTGLLIVRGQ